MQDNKYKETQSKTIRIEKELIEKIEKLREGTERTFSQQVRLMLKNYINMLENK